MTERSHHRCGPLLALLLVAITVLVACGDDDSDGRVVNDSGNETTDEGAGDEADDSGEPSGGATFLTACELFPEDEAEAIIGTDLELLEASDDFRCSYVAVDGGLAGAVLSVLPTAASIDDLDVVRNAYKESTVEDLPGLGDAAFWHDDGPIHDVQFIAGDIWVTIAVAELVGSDDYRAAALQIAEAAEERLTG